MGRTISEHQYQGSHHCQSTNTMGRTISEHLYQGSHHFRALVPRVAPFQCTCTKGRSISVHRYAPLWWAILRLATRTLVAGVKLPSAVKPTSRTNSTSSKNLRGTSPVHRSLFFLEMRGSEVVASPVGKAHVLRKVAS